MRDARPMIFAAMADILNETGAIGKDRKNQQQGFMFRGIDDLYNALHSAFAKHGVFILTEVLTHEQSERTTKSGSAMYHHLLTARFTFTARDGSSVAAVGMGEAMDMADKGVNKCLSIALKYVLFQAFLIPTEEVKDPDATTPPETVPVTRQQSKTNPSAVPVATWLERMAAATSTEHCRSVWKDAKADGINRAGLDALTAAAKEWEANNPVIDVGF